MSSARTPRAERTRPARSKDPRGDDRIVVTAIKAFTDMGMGPEQILEDEGYEIDPESVKLNSSGQAVRFEMVMPRAQYDELKQRRNRQASAADAPRIGSSQIQTTTENSTTSVPADRAGSFMGDVEDIGDIVAG